MSGSNHQNLDITGPQAIIDGDEQNKAKLWCLGKASLTLNVMVVTVMVTSISLQLASVFPPFMKLLRLFRLFRLLPVIDIFVVSGALCAIRSLTTVPRGLECCAGCPCIPWSFMILGTVSGVDAFVNVLTIMHGPANGQGIVAVVVWTVRVIDAVLLFVLGKTWLRRSKEDGISYAVMP